MIFPQNDSRRCSTCGINFPANPMDKYGKCLACEEPTEYVSNDGPDKDWATKVHYQRGLRDQAEQIQQAIPHILGELNIYEEDAQFFVAQSDLIRAGLRMNREASLWLFAANGHVWEAQGWDEPRRRWWIESVSLALPAEVTT